MIVLYYLRTLDCGNHNCQNVCHIGVCKECLLKPSILTSCPCGKTPVFDLLGGHDVRKSCLDPVPTCKLMCGKVLPCSPSKGILARPWFLTRQQQNPWGFSYCVF